MITDKMRKYLEDAGLIYPSHERTVVYGKWQDAMQSCNDSPHVKCSVCGEYYWQYFKKFNFCPNCGAYMQKNDI